jgi:hypothetical protein
MVCLAAVGVMVEVFVGVETTVASTFEHRVVVRGLG